MKATETTIIKFIGGENKVFIIPPFQRNYEWTTEQCEELFEDILIDGQQRVTTILLLLCAIRDISSDDLLKKKIDKKYLKNEDADDAYRVRLKQTDYDEGCFERLVDGTFRTDETGKIAKN